MTGSARPSGRWAVFVQRGATDDQIRWITRHGIDPGEVAVPQAMVVDFDAHLITVGLTEVCPAIPGSGCSGDRHGLSMHTGRWSHVRHRVVQLEAGPLTPVPFVVLGPDGVLRGANMP